MINILEIFGYRVYIYLSNVGKNGFVKFKQNKI